MGQASKESLEEASHLIDSLKLDQAIALLQKVLTTARDEKNDTLELSVLFKLGGVYLDLEKNEIGLNYYRKAREKASSINDKKNFAKAHYGIGAAYQLINKNIDSAIYHYHTAISYFQTSGDIKTLSYIYDNLSLLFSNTNQLDSMRFYLNKALAIQEKLGDHIGIGTTYANLAMLARNKNNFEEAIRLYKRSTEEFKKANETKEYTDNLKWLAYCFFKLKTYDSAALYYHIRDTLVHDLYHEDYQDKILELETKYQTAEVERDNAVKQAQIEESRQRVLLLVIVLVASFALFTIGFILVQQRRKLAAAAAEKTIQDLIQKQEMDTAYALLAGQDKERKRIAAELHDNLGSILTSLTLFSDAMQHQKAPEQLAEIASKISETSTLANDEVRKISHSLDTGLLHHFGLKAAITQLLEAVATAKDIRTQLDLHFEDPLPNDTGLEVYRIVQELTNNTLKHAHCHAISLEINHVDTQLTLIFQDDGTGFDPAKITRGMGLDSIGKRAQRLGGGLSIESAPGKGSTFIITLPQI